MLTTSLPATLEAPLMTAPRRLTADWTQFTAWAPLPGLGAIPVNAYLLKGREPVLVDTGIAPLGDDFIAALSQEIDPAEIAWIWISHADADHIGNLARVLALAPKARILAAYIGLAKLALLGFDPGRVRMIEPGMVLDAGGRRLHPVRPPYYDAPETTGFYDPAGGVLYAVDSFGAVLPAPAAHVEDVAEAAFKTGMIRWSSLDAPWLAGVDRPAFGRRLKAIERLQPRHFLSAHLPVLDGKVGTLTRIIAETYAGVVPPPGDGLTLETALGGFTAAPEMAA